MMVKSYGNKSNVGKSLLMANLEVLALLNLANGVKNL
jgi:hypothetical protein